jgi:hypothetical protein
MAIRPVMISDGLLDIFGERHAALIPGRTFFDTSLLAAGLLITG